jgi:hypothetical protein
VDKFENSVRIGGQTMLLFSPFSNSALPQKDSNSSFQKINGGTGDSNLFIDKEREREREREIIVIYMIYNNHP